MQTLATYPVYDAAYRLVQIDHPSGTVYKWEWVEADNADEANDIAEEHGVYFDDDYDIDCECCGARWYPVSEYDATEQPEVYGEPAEGYVSPFAEYDHVRSVKVVRK